MHIDQSPTIQLTQYLLAKGIFLKPHEVRTSQGIVAHHLSRVLTEYQAFSIYDCCKPNRRHFD